MPKAKLEPFLKANCTRCHGAEKQKGDVRFDDADWMINTNDEAQRWQDVLDVLNGGDMPPEDETQPAPAELSKALSTLTNTLLKARKRLTDHGGEIVMRRLNQREYANSIRDLFGFEIPHSMIPEDGEAESFDTVGDEQFYTSSHFGKYLDLGREIAARGFEWAGMPPLEAKKTRRQPEENITHRLRDKLAELDEKMRMKNEGKTWQEMGFKDAGEAKIVFSQFNNRAGKPRQYLQYPLVDSGMYVVDANNETKRFGVNHNGADPRGTYRYRVRAGVVGDPLEIRKFVLVTDNVGPVGTMKVRGTDKSPEVIEMTYQPKIGQRNVSLSVEENRADIRVLDSYLRRLDKDGEWASIWIDWVEIEGPFYESTKSFFGDLIHPGGYERGKTSEILQDKNAHQLIKRFAFEAFRRRAPDPVFVDKLVALFDADRAEGQKYTEAMGEVLAVILASPGFLFVQEQESATEKPEPLDHRELAIRLSFFLWSSPPDEELYRCAEDGSISKPAVLRQQVDRMLNDPKARSFYEGFASQWGELDRFDAITVDETENFLFNAGIRQAASTEVVEFFQTLVKENLPASNLIDSDFVTINSVLAEHYGIDGVKSDAFQKVRLPAKSPRGGLLGQTAFLTLGSNGERSSPVIRGAYVLEKLLHDKPPPPPPNVPELGSATKNPATNRQMVELHQNQAQCSSCHQKMDVIGFGLENFDTIGKWRNTEKVGRSKQVPIEPGGTLPDGAAFSDIQGLKSVLAEQDNQLAEELVESILAYGLGRTIEFSDADAIDAILKSLEKEDYPLRSMIHEIVASPLFKKK
jgi:hypothetical protein